MDYGKRQPFLFLPVRTNTSVFTRSVSSAELSSRPGASREPFALKIVGGSRK
jgi:hypothetical protein